MSALVQSFGFGEQLVRVIDRADGIWFVAKDVCDVLEIGNSRQAVAALEDDEKDGVIITDTIGRHQTMAAVSESGMYALVFKSRKAAAKTFRRWVTSEVLPSIRTTGRYEVANDEGDEPPSIARLPEEYEQRRLQLQMVREARIAFGPSGARRMWAIAGLPDLTPPPLLEQAEPATIGRWIEARTEVCPDAKWSARALYDDYFRWCVGLGEPAVTQTTFGRALSRRGFAPLKATNVYRAGIKLKSG